MSIELKKLLFPNVTLTREELLNRYPERKVNVVTRFAPSPTGFLHIGGVYTSLINRKLASQNDGVFFLRLEDTDKKREVPGSRKIITNIFNHLGIKIDEGVVSDTKEIGLYGPYVQSNRVEIYHALAAYLVEKGYAYPCFATEEELEELRSRQELEGKTPGYYKEYAIYRDCPLDKVRALIEEGRPYVLRFRVPDDAHERIQVKDLIKGDLEMDNNFNDFVLLKADGIPTYHFAHACDDFLMHTTHVIRGDEWISSLPIHVELFNALGFKLPNYAHVAPVMKLDGESRRKLSKRKDPESNAEFYLEKGYPVKALFVYLYTLINSNFEQWYLANKDKDLDSFEMTFDAMAKSGPLYDIEKLNNISSEMIYDTPQEKNIENLLAWANEYNKDDYEILNNDLEFVKKILSTQGPNSREHRKDLKTYSDFMETFGFLYDDYFKNMSFDEINAFKENVPSERINKVLDAYIDYFTNTPEGTTLKDLAKNLGYTDKKKYNKNPELYVGLFTEFYQILNLALSHKVNCISVEDVIDVLGKEKVIARLGELKQWI